MLNYKQLIFKKISNSIFDNYIVVNDKQIFVEDWSMTVLQFCDYLNLSIPRFCYHDKLSIAGNCRMCMVEVKSSFKPIIACATSMLKKMTFHLNSLMVKQARENVIEFLLINHPLDCPICDQGSECDLQDQALIFGSDRGRFKEIKRSVNDLFLGPVIKTIMTRCIHCTRCVRFSDEVIGNSIMGTLGRGKMTEIGTYSDKYYIDELSGNVVDLCPVGALTSKSYAFKARAWELKSIESIDIFDSLSSNIRVDIKGNEIMRILPKRNDYINEEWITDKVRFSYESLKKNRILYPMLRNSLENPLVITSYQLFFSNLIEKFKEYYKLNNNKLNDIVHINLSNFFTSSLDYYIINNLFSYLGINNINNIINNKNLINNDFRTNYLFNDNFINFNKTNLFLINNLNIKKINPIINSKIKKLKMNNSNNLNISYIGPNINLNYDYIHLSSNQNTLYNILEGKHYYSIYINSFKQKKILSNNSSINLNNYLTELDISSSNILETSSLTSVNELGYSNYNSNKYNRSKNTIKINYYYNVEDSITLSNNSNNLNIYHGTNITENIKKISNFVIPSTSIYEEKLIFSNLFGFTQNTNICISSIKNQFYGISDLFLNLNNLFFKLLFKNSDLNLSSLFLSITRCNSLIISSSYLDIYPYYNIKKFFPIKKLLCNHYKNNYYVLNSKNVDHNYYQTDNYSLNSDTLQKCSLIINSNKNNFLKNLISYEYYM